MSNKDNLKLLISTSTQHFNSMEFSKRKDYAFYGRIDRILEIEHYKKYLKEEYQNQLKKLNKWQNNLVESGLKEARELGWLDE